MKSELAAKRIIVVTTASSNSIFAYFNLHDPSPVYSRPLSPEFEKYLNNFIAGANRHSVTCNKQGIKNNVNTALVK